MAETQAQRIVDTALRLRQQDLAARALDILDEAMQGQLGSSPDFSVRHPEYDDHTDPASTFGELLRQAFAPSLDVLCDARAQERWQTT